jgi:hypothetical protein
MWRWTSWRGVDAGFTQDLAGGLGYAVADGRERVLAGDIWLKTTPGKGQIEF